MTPFASSRPNGRMKETGHYHGLYIGDPDIDFVKLADSQGVKGERVMAGRCRRTRSRGSWAGSQTISRRGIAAISPRTRSSIC